MLKFMGKAKRTDTELLEKQLNDKTEHKNGERPNAGAAQTPTQVIPAPVEHDNGTSSPPVSKNSAVQHRVTTNEVQDEADTNF